MIMTLQPETWIRDNHGMSHSYVGSTRGLSIEIVTKLASISASSTDKNKFKYHTVYLWFQKR